MRKLHVILGLLAIIAVGCPWFGDYEFRSADLRSSRNSFGNLLDVVAAEGAGDAEETEETREVVEPDVIRRDGDLLYVLNQYRGLTMVDLDGRSIIAQLPTYGYPRDLYVRDDRAYVLVGCARDYAAEGDTVTFTVAARLFVVGHRRPRFSQHHRHFRP